MLCPVDFRTRSGDAPPMRSRKLLAACCAPILVLLLGCPSKEKVGSNAMAVLGPGVVNDPKNKSLRFDILQFGLERFCQEMTRRSVPLKLADDQPVRRRLSPLVAAQQAAQELGGRVADLPGQVLVDLLAVEAADVVRLEDFVDHTHVEILS